MKDQAETLVPAHLQELLRPTSSGTAKLIAAWDGLSLETQIAVLIAKKERPGPPYLYQRIIDKALVSNNAFVRYMASKAMSLIDPHEAEKNFRVQIENDPDPLVRYAHLERDCLSRELADPEKFFALPHEARLATVRGLGGDGESIATLISYAVEQKLKEGQVSEIELFELLSDYLSNPEFKKEYVDRDFGYDGYGEYLADQDLQTLWGLVPKVPEGLSHAIIEHLPWLIHGIPKHVLDGMSDRQLSTLFSRPEVRLEHLRKQKFLEATNGATEEKDYAKDHMRATAIWYWFDLTNDEFARILAKPEESRVRILGELATMAQDLRLCLYQAIHDVLFVSEVSQTGEAYIAKKTFERKLKELKGEQRDRELTELRVYRLAVRAVPWEKDIDSLSPTDELAFLKEAVVEGDTWATFTAFSRKWNEALPRTKRLESFLPRIWEASEESSLTLDSAYEKTLAVMNSLKDEIILSRRMQRLSFWLIIGLLVVLFIRPWITSGISGF